MLQRNIVMGTLVLLLLPVIALAQANATVTGAVSDATGAVMPSVEVTARNVNTGIETLQITNESGVFNFASLQPGTYAFSAALPGFQTQTFQNAQLSQGQQVRLNFTLGVAGAATTVDVTADADAVLAVTTTSVGDVLPEMEVRSLPLAVRNVMGLINATPGAEGRYFSGLNLTSLNVIRDGLVVNDARYGAGDPGVGGEGQNATYVSPDLVEEVQIVTAAVDPEAGRGSGQVRLQTRSGTNEFHGALFYLNNNSALNAQTWFNNLVGAEKAYVNRHQYGGRLGGPIVRNKAFFFVLIDNQRYMEKENFVGTVFTEEARRGIFRYVPGQRNAHALAAQPSVDLAGRPLGPVSSFNLFSDVRDPLRTSMTTVPYWRDILTKHMPPANDFTTGDGLNLAGHRFLRRIEGQSGGNNVGDNNNRDQLNARIDYQLNSANRLSFTMSREELSSTTPNDWPTGHGGISNYYPHVYNGQWTSIISPAVLNEFRIGRAQSGFWQSSPFELESGRGATHTDRSPEAQALFDTLPKINGYPLYVTTAATNAGFAVRPTLPATVFANQGFGTTRGNFNPRIQLSDTLSWTRGRHSFRIGADASFSWSDGWNTTLEQFPKAVLGEGPTPIDISSARFPGLDATDATLARDILSDLAGSVRGITQGFIINSSSQTEWDTYLTESRRMRKVTQNDWAVFFKDTWTATGNLTLNLGLRYDKFGVVYDAKGLLPNAVGGQAGAFGISGTGFDSLWNPNATGGSLTAIQLVGKNSPNPKPLYPDDWNNIAPSFGFSYNVPWLDRPTVVRGGYGINYTGVIRLLDFELGFLNTPGSVTREAQTVSQLGFNYLNLETAISSGVLPLTPSFQPDPAGQIIVPLTDRSQLVHLMGDERPVPYVQSFNLSIQRELIPRLTLEVSYVGTKATKLYGNVELNETNILENQFLEAFNRTRAGGDHPLFDRMLRGLTVPGAGRVDGAALTGSQALRLFGSTRNWIADGNVGALADFLNRSSAITGVPGGFLRNGGLSENFFVVNPQFRRVELWLADRNSIYHSMQVQLRKQLSHGFSAQFTHTWSKALGDAINLEHREGTQVLDPRNRQSLNRGRLSFDRTHSFKAHAAWELPFGPGRTFLAGSPNWIQRVVEGWQLASIFSWNSGAPLNLTSPIGTMGGTRTLSVPDAVGLIPKSLGEVRVGNGFVEYFEGLSSGPAPLPNFGSDPGNLRQRFGNRVIVDSSGNVLLRNPEPGSVGTLGLRYLQGPSLMKLDLGISKRVLLREGTSLTLRTDLINALNTPQWGNPNTDINAPAFGRITQADGARLIIINARIEF